MTKKKTHSKDSDEYSDDNPAAGVIIKSSKKELGHALRREAEETSSVPATTVEGDAKSHKKDQLKQIEQPFVGVALAPRPHDDNGSRLIVGNESATQDEILAKGFSGMCSRCSA